MKLSVIIPTHNNAAILPECLRRITNQSLASEEYEALVVNDGSTDGTAAVLDRVTGFRIVASGMTRGPSHARNLGIREARADLVVFIQDDILVEPDFLEKHLKFHEEHREDESILIGHTQLDPRLPPTPFADWWDNGHQFRFLDPGSGSGMTGKSYLNFYPTNLSVKKEFLVKNGLFDEEFFINGHIGYEDTELGYRLWKAGMRLHYDPTLKVWHHHLRTLKNISEQSYYKGQLARLLYKKHPELQKVFKDDLKYNLTRWLVTPFTIKLLEPLAYWCENRFNVGLLFWVVCRYYYNRGYVTTGKSRSFTWRSG